MDSQTSPLSRHLLCVTSKCHKLQSKGHNRQMHLARFPQIRPGNSNNKPGKPGSYATLPQVFPGPLLRICVSVLDTLIHSHQLAGAHHPSVLEKLAFKLRYFREVNHPGEASTVCSLSLWKGARSFGLELLSLQGGVGSSWTAHSHLKGWHQTLKCQCRRWFKLCPISRPQLNTSLSATCGRKETG